MNKKPVSKYNPGIGATQHLSLRVSVATLVRVVFKHPVDGEWMLALERKATLQEARTGQLVEVKSQPFGGAIRIRNLSMLRDQIGDFHFDSERSSSEQDFRIFVNPANWGLVRECCTQHFSRVDDAVLETDPRRELAEEFFDALKISIKPEQFSPTPIGMIVEDDPVPTENIHAKNMLTARVYRIFEARIVDSFLISILLKNSEGVSHQALNEWVLEDFKKSGKGRANAVLALPLQHLIDCYLSKSPEERNTTVLFENNRLDETVTAVLEGVDAPKYRRLSG